MLLAVGVALTVAGALLGPETVRTDLSGGVPDRATAVPTTPIDGQVNEAMSGHRELHPEATRPVAAVRPRRPG